MTNKFKKLDNSRKESDALVTQIDADISEEELALAVQEISEKAAAETIAVLLEGIVILWGLDFAGKD